MSSTQPVWAPGRVTQQMLSLTTVYLDSEPGISGRVLWPHRKTFEDLDCKNRESIKLNNAEREKEKERQKAIYSPI